MIREKNIYDIGFGICLKKAVNYIKNIFSIKDYVLANLVVITGQRCNLKCRHCSNFSPYLDNINAFYAYKDICRDMQIISKNVLNIEQIQLQGGEFFLHPDKSKILKYFVRNKKIKKIILATNGTVIPENEFLILIKSSRKIFVRISNYGKINDVLTKRLEARLKEFGIDYYIHQFINNNSMWTYLGDKDMKRLPETEMLKSYGECIFAKWCLTLENGFISICSRATSAHLVQKFSISDKDGIFVRDKFNIDKFKSFVENKPPVEACYYCYGSKGKEIIPAEQMNKEELDIISPVQSSPVQSSNI